MPLVEITDPKKDRYATLNLISWWEQERLRRARVMVLGTGALGNEVLKNLALLGIGRLFLVDSDVVEAANLTRSVLFRMADAGRRKVDAAAEEVRRINPDVKVATLHGDVSLDLGLGVYRQMDVVLGCLDNRAARVAVNRACWRAGVPWIDGAMDVLMGIVRVYVPPDCACYECTMNEQDYELMNLRYSCPLLRSEDLVQGRQPTVATTASIIAAMQVQEAVKLLHGLDVPVGKGIYYNGRTHATSVISYVRREGCYAHAALDAVTPLAAGADATSVKAFLQLATRQAADDLTLLLDREVATSLYCPRCEHTETVWRPFDTVVPDMVPCPTCHSNRLPEVATRVASTSDLPDVLLRTIGVPPLQILRAESASRRFAFELSGDMPQVFAAWSVP